MKFKFPSAQTILLIIAAMVAILTFIVPAGKYDSLLYNSDTQAFDKVSLGTTTSLPATQSTLDSLNILIPLANFTSGDIYKPIGIPDTYKSVESSPQGIAAFIKSPIKGIIAAADIIFLVLIIGGLIGIMNLSGAFDAGIAWLARTLKGREYLLIILVTTLVALGGTTFGLAEETMAFYPILIPVFIAARYDAIVGLASVFLGSAVGTMCSTINPFSAIIASDAAGINWTTGLTGRAIMLGICVAITILYIMRYAKKVQSDPSNSIVYDQKEELDTKFGYDATGAKALTGRLKLILFVFMMCFIIMIMGVVKWDWWFVEMTTTFFVGSVIIGFIAKLKESDFLNAFSEGASDLLSVAFIIGIARGVSIIMDDGQISDTMLYYASHITEGMNKGVFTNAMLFIYSGLSFFIPSSSGMAVLTMPIMSPLADTVGVGREVIVNTYQYGMGLFFFINPTGLILASLAIVNIGFDKWLKFVLPLFFILVIVTMSVLTISVYL